MDAQEQAKISAISKKPNVRFAATEDPPPDRVQPILDGLQKVLQTVLDNQNRSPEANVGEKVPGNGGFKMGKGKGNRAQSPANMMFPEGDPMRLQLPGPGMTISPLDGTKDVKAINTIVPLLQIVKHEDLDGTQEALQVPRILTQGTGG